MLSFQIRRQGRNFGASGDKVKFSNKPVTVKDPSQFVPPTDARRVTFDDEKAPVFSLEKMIQEEAEKLKNQVRVSFEHHAKIQLLFRSKLPV